MTDDLYIAVMAGLALILVLGTLLGIHRDAAIFRQMREGIARIGTCPACHHDEHPSFCMVMVGERLTCGCDLMTDPED
jgi:hypothetical protein